MPVHQSPEALNEYRGRGEPYDAMALAPCT